MVNDLWYSDDKGTNWHEVSYLWDKMAREKILGINPFAYDDKLWLLGGGLVQLMLELKHGGRMTFGQVLMSGIKLDSDI